MGRPRYHVKAWFISYKDQLYALNSKGDLIDRHGERVQVSVGKESVATQTQDEEDNGFLITDDLNSEDLTDERL